MTSSRPNGTIILLDDNMGVICATTWQNYCFHALQSELAPCRHPPPYHHGNYRRIRLAAPLYKIAPCHDASMETSPELADSQLFSTHYGAGAETAGLHWLPSVVHRYARPLRSSRRRQARYLASIYEYRGNSPLHGPSFVDMISPQPLSFNCSRLREIKSNRGRAPVRLAQPNWRALGSPVGPVYANKSRQTRIIG
jgi:hypothetical protein